MPDILKKIIIIFSVIVFILFLGFVIAAWILGAFETVNISQNETGPYYFLTFRSAMTYKELPQKTEELKTQLDEYKIRNYVPGALVLNNPMNTPLGEVNVRGGFIISDSVAVSDPHEILYIHRRAVVVATIEANPAIATFKTYPALGEWMRNNDRNFRAQLPFLEIYHPDESVSTEMPIASVDSTK